MDQPSKGRRLLIMRHAKSDRGTPGEPDFDRPLAKRGQRDALRMGEWLRAQGLVQDLVLASPARRARETASKVCKVLDIEKQAIQWEPRIYDATRADLIEVLADCPADRRLVLLVGHNPGLEELLEYLSGAAVHCPGVRRPCRPRPSPACVSRRPGVSSRPDRGGSSSGCIPRAWGRLAPVLPRRKANGADRRPKSMADATARNSP
ncbi:MAG: histidine phosphatase family protein [Pseudomonadota bacterium]|nr:histidine phosphatase family protein [Pseudomonadota bacterium]